jgi:hypothetical protein
MPHLANDEYHQQFATYVRDNLRPDVKVYVEWSNEVWHTGFAGGRACVCCEEGTGGGSTQLVKSLRQRCRVVRAVRLGQQHQEKTCRSCLWCVGVSSQHALQANASDICGKITVFTAGGKYSQSEGVLLGMNEEGAKWPGGATNEARLCYYSERTKGMSQIWKVCFGLSRGCGDAGCPAHAAQACLQFPPMSCAVVFFWLCIKCKCINVLARTAR